MTDVVDARLRNLELQAIRIARKLDNLTRQGEQILYQGDLLMALGQDILDAVTRESTLIDSFIAFTNNLVANNVIDSATADAIKAKLAEGGTKLETALAAGTTPPTT